MALETRPPSTIDAEPTTRTAAGETAPGETVSSSSTVREIDPVVWRGPAEKRRGLSLLLRAMWQSARDRLTDRSTRTYGDAVRGFTCCHCGTTRARSLFDTEIPDSKGYRPVRCEACHLVAIHPMPAPSDVPTFYESTYYGVDNAKFGPLTEFFVHLFRRARVSAIRRAGVRNGRVLDLGCARGLLLTRLETLGYRVYGTELTEHSAQAARRRLGEDRVRVGRLVDCGFDDEMFRAITAWQVFEHLCDPGATLDECHRILEPGGVLILAVPNIDSWQARWSGANWFHLDVPRHIFHFCPATLTRLVESHGFRVERVTHQNLEQNPFGLLQSALHRLGFPTLGLYGLLRGAKGSQRIGRLRRVIYLGLYLMVFPLAAALSWVWASLGSGATFTIYARRGKAPN